MHHIGFFSGTLHSKINTRIPDGTDSCSVLLLMPGGVADNKWKDGRQQNLDGIVCCYSDDILMLLPFHM